MCGTPRGFRNYRQNDANCMRAMGNPGKLVQTLIGNQPFYVRYAVTWVPAPEPLSLSSYDITERQGTESTSSSSSSSYLCSRPARMSDAEIAGPHARPGRVIETEPQGRKMR